MACAFPKDSCSEYCTPYTKEVENGIRFSALLINEGTKAVRTKFHEKLKETNFPSVTQALQNQNIKSKLESLYKGKRKLPKLLNDQQYKLLYPTKGKPNSDNFDLTLLTFLFRNVLKIPPPISTKNWRETPNNSDTTISADLVRIRLMRNELYGHITHLGIPDEEFSVLWMDLEGVLLRLGTNAKHIDTWKSKPLSQTLEKEYRTKVTTLIENDLSEMQSLTKLILQSLTENKEFYRQHVSQLEDVIHGLSSGYSSNATQLEFKFAEVLQLLSNLPGEIANVILQNVHSTNLEIKKTMNDIKTYLAQRIEAQKLHLINLDKSSSKILTSIEAVQEDVTRGSESVNELKKQTTMLQDSVVKLCQGMQQLDETNNATMQQIQMHLKQNPTAFRILLFNKPVSLETGYKHVRNEFCFALGTVPWDIIIDLDHDSRTESGVFENIAHVLKKQKDFKVITYDELTKLSDDDKENVANGLKTLWLLANGCSYIGCNPIENQIGVLISKIYPFFEGILTKLQTLRPLLLVNLIMSETIKWPLSQIVQAFTFTCESMKERINFDDSNILSIYFEDSQKSHIPNSVGDIEHFQSKVTPSQMIFVLVDCFPFGDLEKKFFFPGDKTKCLISSEDMAQLQPYVELYHSKIGEINFDSKTEEEIEEMVDSIKYKFLKGHKLTPEGMYVHENFSQIYVARGEMKAVKEIIEKSLDEKEHWLKKNERTYHGKYEILHDSSGSGSTTAVYLLYRLREKYPCLSVKKISAKTVALLKKISKDSRKPLLLIVDSAEYKSSDVSTLQYWLENEQIKSLIVHVRRLVSADSEYKGSQDSEVSNSKCYISSKIQSESDKVAFKMLYEAIKRKIKADRVYLFGLIAFCEDYSRLDTHITGCLEGMTDEQKSMLSLIFQIFNFCHSTVKVGLLLNLLEKKTKTSKLEDVLGFGCDLVVLNKTEFTVRPAHHCLLKPFQQIYRKGQTQAALMGTFMDNLYKMFSFSNSSKENSLPLCHDLFIQRENPKEELFSSMVTSLSEDCGGDYVAEQMQRFINLYQGITKQNHLRGLYARYLMYKLNKPDEALQQITTAVGIQTSQSIEIMTGSESNPVLLTTYAGLFRYYGKHKFQTCPKEENASKAIELSIPFFEESVRAYKLAQGIKQSYMYSRESYNHVSKYTPLPFIGEAKTRWGLLQLCFYHKCKRKHDLFRTFMEKNKNPFIHESEKEAMDALDKIHNLISIDRLHDDEPLQTKQTILETKFKLLLLRYDKSTTVQGMLKTIPHEVPCDVGTIVKMGIPTLRYTPGAFIKLKWKELNIDQLKLIIDTIMKRITSASMLSCNYMDVIVAMIHLRHIKAPTKFREYNIDLALQIAREWVLSSVNDVNAYFLLGVLLVAKAVEKSDHELIKEAVNIHQKCREMCVNNPSAIAVRHMRYAIGDGLGLEKLVPYNLVESVNQKLQVFYGRMIGRNLIVVHPFNGVLKAKSTSSEILTQSDQKPVLKFNIYLQKLNPLLAVNIEVAENEDYI